MKNRFLNLLPIVAIVLGSSGWVKIAEASPISDNVQVAQMQGGPLKDLNLTEEQKTKIQNLRQSHRQQIDAILTPEQRQKLRQHHGRGPGQGSNQGQGPNRGSGEGQGQGSERASNQGPDRASTQGQGRGPGHGPSSVQGQG